MGSAICCQSCGAPIMERICGWCGNDTGIEIVSQEKSFEIREDERFIPCYMYARKKALYEGEIGMLNGARIVIKEKPSE